MWYCEAFANLKKLSLSIRILVILPRQWYGTLLCHNIVQAKVVDGLQDNIGFVWLGRQITSYSRKTFEVNQVHDFSLMGILKKFIGLKPDEYKVSIAMFLSQYALYVGKGLLSMQSVY